ncbi:hypothetical protein [Streptomyces purpureus]|uniref:hypothetical protein n=1 Tax=Streptomyces purpureus TaxID=1951 RepID=UPI0003711B96|nr:hypothetical protein [Streptomyces purpureus]
MTERPPEDEKKVVNQTNRGSGTFVGGNVLGNIVNLFMPSHRRPSPHSGNRAAPPEDDYDDITFNLLGCVIIGMVSGTGLMYCIRGVPFTDTAPAPDLAKRLVGGVLFFLLFVGCVAAFLARTAQGFELWAGRCADLAVDTRVRLLAYLPASLTQVMASAALVTATIAAFFALLFGWGEFGRSVQERAHIARDNAAMHAERARAAIRGIEGH